MTEKRFIAINDATTNDWELHDQLLKCTTLSTNTIGITKLLNELSEENKDLKDFIRKISTNNEIILANGTIYKIDKVIK